jgi:DNA-directed RNA polymerase specialized sigma24 family protein
MDVDQAQLTDLDGYQLFRRAIVERDEEAWAEISTLYRRMLISWANHYSVRIKIDETSADIADQALTRAWMALSPERFARFPNLAALLAYLHTSVLAAVIDTSRAQVAHQRMVHKLEAGDVLTPEQIVVQKYMRAELWRRVNAVVRTPQERIILVESFVFDLSPGAIKARHPDLFADVETIYTMKRNLLNRLQHNPDLQRLRQDLRAPITVTSTRSPYWEAILR